MAAFAMDTPINIDALTSVILQALAIENDTSTGESSIMALPEGAIAYIIGRQMFAQRTRIWGTAQAEWRVEYLADTLQPEIQFEARLLTGKIHKMRIMPKLLEDIEEFRSYCDSITTLGAQFVSVCIFQEYGARLREWTQVYTDAYNMQLRPLSLPLSIGAAEQGAAEASLWVLLLEPQTLINTDTDEVQAIGTALYDAVHNMSMENMINVLRKIIALRTDVDEVLLTPETHLSTIYKMSFAKEQGVNLDEVYDPEAFGGYTDSQLAAHNLLEDLQKTFGLPFEDEEAERIRTLNDLASALLSKRYQSY